MGTVVDIFSRDVPLLPKYFEEWRGKEIEAANAKCAKLEEVVRENYNNLNQATQDDIKAIKKIPKTMVRLTRHMCECQELCTKTSLYEVYFARCKLFDLSHVKEDDRFFDSSMNTMKVVDGRLYNRNVNFATAKLQNDIKTILGDLCNDKKGSLRKLKCKAYELKEFCGNDTSCLHDVVKDLLPFNYRHCIKPEFESDLKNIGGKIYEPNLFTSPRDKREVQEYGQVSSLGSTMNQTKVYLMILGVISVSCVPIIFSQSGNTKIAKFLCLLVFAFFGIFFMGNIN